MARMISKQAPWKVFRALVVLCILVVYAAWNAAASHRALAAALSTEAASIASRLATALDKPLKDIMKPAGREVQEVRDRVAELMKKK